MSGTRKHAAPMKMKNRFIRDDMLASELGAMLVQTTGSRGNISADRVWPKDCQTKTEAKTGFWAGFTQLMMSTVAFAGRLPKRATGA